MSGPSDPPTLPPRLPCGTTVTQHPDGVDEIHHVDCGANPLASLDPDTIRRAAEFLGKFLARA